MRATYTSPSHTPSPWAIEVIITWNNRHVNLDLTYPGKEAFTEQELADEGIPPDLSWNMDMEINSNWETYINQIIKKVVDGKAKRGQLDINYERYLPDELLSERFINEWIQAFLEYNKKEKPLLIELVSTECKYKLTASFYKLEAYLHQDNRKIKLEWDQWKQLAEPLYLVEYPYEKAKESPEKGTWINFGDHVWLPFYDKKLLKKWHKLFI